MQFWILGSALGCFGAGMTTGLALPDVLRACGGADTTSDPDEAYVRGLAADFGLSAAQERQLRIVVQRWRAEELSIVRNAGYAELPSAMRAQWDAAEGRVRERVRALLDDEQRARYDSRTARNGGR